VKSINSRWILKSKGKNKGEKEAENERRIYLDIHILRNVHFPIYLRANTIKYV